LLILKFRDQNHKFMKVKGSKMYFIFFFFPFFFLLGFATYIFDLFSLCHSCSPSSRLSVAHHLPISQSSLNFHYIIRVSLHYLSLKYAFIWISELCSLWEVTIILRHHLNCELFISIKYVFFLHNTLNVDIFLMLIKVEN
jgi:hypothetical protein